MTDIENFGRLGELVGASALPSSLGAAQDLASQALNKIAYRDLVIEKSPGGDHGYYGLRLVCKELSSDLFGSGLKLIYFPAQSPSDPASEFPVSFEYRWPVRKYFREFEVLSFERTGKAFFEILGELIDVEPPEMLAAIVACFINDPAPYQALVGKLQQWGGNTAPWTGLSLANRPAGVSEAEHIAAQITAADIDASEAVFEAVVNDVGDIEGTLGRLVTLARRWLGEITRSDFERLLIPQFAVALQQVSMAIEVPRTVLIPLKADGTEEPAINWRLTFTTGGMRYDSEAGFDIGIDEGLAVNFPRAMIPRLGVTLAFEGIQIDLSRTSNIAAADAEGRPPDFIGVSIARAEIGLPKKWFAKHVDPDNPATLGIVGRGLLIGTGGFSGEVGLEVLAIDGKPKPIKDVPPAPIGTTPPPELQFVLGKAPAAGEDRKGFIVGFSTFTMTFRQNHLLNSRIKGSLTMPGFQSSDPKGNRIDIELFLDSDGDFEISAGLNPGRKFEVPNIFSFTLQKIRVGKGDRGLFLACTGDLSFANNALLGQLITQPIHLEELRIGSDGSVSLKGGEVPLPKSATLNIGPAKITISAIQFGSFTRDHGGVERPYRFIGFSGAVSCDPGAVGGRGDGVRLCYSVDDLPRHMFMEVDGIGISIMIPGGASAGDAVLRVEGYLKLKKPVYQGSIKFALPKVGFVGGAAMAYDTSFPAWIIRVDLQLPTVIPLGSLPIGIYSFSGLFGWLYTASKQAQAIQPPLPDDASWGDYYRAPQRGIGIEKFSTPKDNKSSRKPFSVGVGVGLCTSNDDGHILSMQVFLLVSLSNLILLEGGFVLLEEEKLAPTDTPPFYAYMALAPGESFEFGSGIDYLVPKDSGKVLKINVVLKAYFSFRNSSAWYLELGNKAHPCTADILGMFRGYAYLALSATGIETGAGVSFDFVKRYGPIGVEAHAYLDFWAYISFLNGHAGGGIGMGGMLDATMFGFGFHIGLAAILSVEAPRPFRVAGSVEVCVSVKILKKRITKCCDVSFVWQSSDLPDDSPAPILTAAADAPPAATAVHMVSGATYPIVFSTSDEPPNDPPNDPPPIPLDCYIDVKFTRPVDPSAVSSLIGGFSSAPEGAGETVPPRYGSFKAEHRYKLEEVALETFENGNWVAYNPYAALTPDGLLDPGTAAQLAAAPIARWQKKGPGYNDLRFLAQTPFSWMAPAVGHRPEELGVTAQSTYCVGRTRTPRCLTWTEPKAFPLGLDQFREGILYRVDGDRMEAVALSQPRLQPVSLAIGPSGQASFQFEEPVAECSIDLVTTAPWVRLRWQRRRRMIVGGVPVGWLPGPPQFEDVGPPQLVQRAALTGKLSYGQPSAPIDRLLIEIPVPDLARIAELKEAIAQAELDWNFLPAQREALAGRIAELRRSLRIEHDKTCLSGNPYGGDPVPRDPNAEKLRVLTDQYREQAAALGGMHERYQRFCVAAAPPPREEEECKADSAANLIGKLGGLGKALAKAIGKVIGKVTGGRPPRDEPPGLSAEACRALAKEIEAAQARLEALEQRIDELGRDRGGGTEGWACGTFVREICYLTEKDFAYNQSLPGIAAIAADYGAMRDAIEGQLQPIWAPGRQYRIRLKVSDTVNASVHTSDYFVHFRTGKSIGLFLVPLSPIDDPGPTLEEDRQEVPERSLLFYVDKEASRPNPTGKLTYEKPVYTRNVEIRLFFDKPHAYHFFADWPGSGQKYKLELMVKDPAETAPDSSAPAHAAPIVAAPYLGTRSWPVDPDPKVPLEVRTLQALRDRVAEPDDASLVCLSEGGEPIVPLARFLLTEIEELDPNKLYTAVVLNRRTDVAEVAEVMSYVFKTSFFADPASHFHSYRLKGANGAERLAVFDINHILPGNAAATIAAAQAIVAGGPVANPGAWPDPYDGLVHGLLELPPRPSAPTVEFNFVTAHQGATFGLLIDGPEPLYDPRLAAGALAGAMVHVAGPDYDPRLPPSAMTRAITLLENDVPIPAEVLWSRDRSKAFVTVAGGGPFPTQNVAIGFAVLDWQGNVTGSVVSDAFSKS